DGRRRSRAGRRGGDPGQPAGHVRRRRGADRQRQRHRRHGDAQQRARAAERQQGRLPPARSDGARRAPARRLVLRQRGPARPRAARRDDGDHDARPVRHVRGRAHDRGLQRRRLGDRRLRGHQLRLVVHLPVLPAGGPRRGAAALRLLRGRGPVRASGVRRREHRVRGRDDQRRQLPAHPARLLERGRGDPQGLEHADARPVQAPRPGRPSGRLAGPQGTDGPVRGHAHGPERIVALPGRRARRAAACDGEGGPCRRRRAQRRRAPRPVRQPADVHRRPGGTVADSDRVPPGDAELRPDALDADERSRHARRGHPVPDARQVLHVRASRRPGSGVRPGGDDVRRVRVVDRGPRPTAVPVELPVRDAARRGHRGAGRGAGGSAAAALHAVDRRGADEGARPGARSGGPPAHAV
ncbi:MAG: hypothetical protein AVDCRST_MAG85-1729, partial [uncultured Solirubrobacteraceae bacterium]